jgi:hypothetical protein
MSDLMTGLRELHGSKGDYLQAEEYYEGRAPEQFASVRLRRALARTGTSFKFNFARIPVDAVVDRLELNSLTSTDKQANLALQELWDDNQLDLEAPNVHRRAEEFGDAYLIIWPSPDDDGDGDIDVDIFYNSPMHCRIVYDPENPRRKLFGIKHWCEAEQMRVNLYYRDRIEKWVTRDPKAKGDREEDWVEYLDADDPTWPLPNPYNQIPMFHFRTDRPYGTPEHKQAYGPQDVINKLVITHCSTIDYQGFPQRYLLADGDTDSDEIAEDLPFPFPAALDTDESQYADGALDRPRTSTAREPEKASLGADPADVWWLKNVKSAGQFAVADPKVFTDPMDRYVKAMAQVTTTPFHFFDSTGDAISGESRQEADLPFTKKVRNRQISFGATWREAMEFALLVAGFEGATVRVQWASPTRVDDLAGWQTIKAKVDAGVPLKQALQEAGYTAEQVNEWLPDDGDLLGRLALFTQVANAAKTLGDAVGTGVVSEQQAKQVITEMLQGLFGEEMVPDPVDPETGLLVEEPEDTETGEETVGDPEAETAPVPA